MADAVIDKATIDNLCGQYEQKINAAKTHMAKYADQPAVPKDVSAQIDKLLGEADEIKAQIELFERVTEGEEFLAKSRTDGPQAAKLLNWRGAGPDEGTPPIDPKAWRELEIKTVQVDPVLLVPFIATKKVRYHVPLAVQKKDYPYAFESYVRKGDDKMGPNDYKTLTEGLDSAGGYLTPEEYYTELIRKMATMATVRSNARVISTSRDVAQWPKIHYTSDDKYTSGVRMTWTGESPASATVHRVTDPVFGTVNVPIHTGMASMPISNNLIEDAAFDVIGISSDLLSEAFSLGENESFWNGNGIMRPMGMLTNVDGDGPASVVTGTAATLLPDGLITLQYAIPSQYDRNSKWYMNKATELVIRKMKATDNTYLWPVWPQAGNFAATPRDLLGSPVVRDEFIPNVGAGAYPIVYGDLTGYLIVDRVGFSIQRLSELYAETNVTLLLARKRVGGQTVEPWRIKVQKVAAS